MMETLDLKTPEVAQNDDWIEISPYANRNFTLFRDFGHALLIPLSKILSWLLSIVEAFRVHHNCRNGHI